MIKDLSQSFRFPLYVSSIDVPKSDANTIPVFNPEYVFQKDVTNELLLFLAQPLSDCLYIVGETGCGKTSIVLNSAAVLGWGVEQITVSNNTEVADLIGHPVLKEGSIVFEYGVLTKAMLNGEILLINEIDTMKAGELSALNDVLEGKPLTIIQNKGEVIKAKPGFRVIATANTKGNGESSGSYSGTRILNGAFMDRFRLIEMPYPNEVQLSAIIKKANPSLLEKTIELLVKFTLEVRRKVEQMEIAMPFSNRALIRTVKLLAVAPTLPISKAIDISYASRLPDDQREFTKRHLEDLFGHSVSEQPESVVQETTPEKPKRTRKATK